MKAQDPLKTMSSIFFSPFKSVSYRGDWAGFQTRLESSAVLAPSEGGLGYLRCVSTNENGGDIIVVQGKHPLATGELHDTPISNTRSGRFIVVWASSLEHYQRLPHQQVLRVASGSPATHNPVEESRNSQRHQRCLPEGGRACLGEPGVQSNPSFQQPLV